MHSGSALARRNPARLHASGSVSCRTPPATDGGRRNGSWLRSVGSPASAGPTTDEALRNAVEAVRLWVEDPIDDGEALPAPRSVEVLGAHPETAAALAAGAVLGMVPLVLDAGRAVRANLSLDAGLLDAIDEAAKTHGLTRSAFLARAGEDRRAFGITREAYRQDLSLSTLVS